MLFCFFCKLLFEFFFVCASFVGCFFLKRDTISFFFPFVFFPSSILSFKLWNWHNKRTHTKWMREKWMQTVLFCSFLPLPLKCILNILSFALTALGIHQTVLLIQRLIFFYLKKKLASTHCYPFVIRLKLCKTFYIVISITRITQDTRRPSMHSHTLTY